jgi:hypothetical protein
VLSAILAAVLLLGACGGSADAAVTVNGVELSDRDFRDELDILRDHPEFSQAAFGATVPTDGGTVDSAFAAEVLRLRILIELVDQEFEARGLELDDEDLVAADATFMPEFQALIDELPESYRDRFRAWNAQLMVIRDALEAEAQDRPDEVTDDEVRAFYDQYEMVFTTEEVCARHVLVATESEADDVIAELAEGADFGEVATDRSTDPSAQMNAGDLGCVGRGQYVPEFETAAWEGPVGEVQGPIETQFGFHVILVDSRGAPGFDSLEPDIRAFLESPASRDGQQLLGLTVDRLVALADVRVSSRYGTWNAEMQSIDPPERPTTTVGAPAGVPGS